MNDRLLELLKLGDSSVFSELLRDLERNPSEQDMRNINTGFQQSRIHRDSKIESLEGKKYELCEEIFKLKKENKNYLKLQCVILNKYFVGKYVQLPVEIIKHNTDKTYSVRVENLTASNSGWIFNINSDNPYIKLKILDFNINCISLKLQDNRQFEYNISYLEEFLTYLGVL